MFTLRAATPGDAERLARAVSDGLESYPSFAPVGWEPPSEEDAAEVVGEPWHEAAIGLDMVEHRRAL